MQLNIVSNLDMRLPEITSSTLRVKKVYDDNALFSRTIFGPTTSYVCNCRINQKYRIGQRCPKCGVLITNSSMRRYATAKIKLPFPIIHPFLFDKLATVNSEIKKIILGLMSGKMYYITEDNRLSETEDVSKCQFIFYHKLPELFKFLLQFTNGKKQLIKVINDNLEHLLVSEVLVLPPDLRPIYNDKIIDDLNHYYSTMIELSNRIKENPLYPTLINIDTNNLTNFPIELYRTFLSNLQFSMQKLYKYIIDKLKSKKGLFRNNILGKRIDFSGRAVIIPDYNLPLSHCGLPYIMVLEFFKLKLASKLVNNKTFISIQTAIEDIEECIANKDYKYFTDCETIVEDEWAILNRQPSLHRLNLLGFKIKVVSGYCIKINPLITVPIAGDFDGDTIAVYIPCTKEAKKEVEDRIWSVKNLISVSNNQITFVPNQDIVLGIYQLTRTDCAKIKEALEFQECKGKRITLGRKLVNDILPEDYPLIDKTIDKSVLMSILSDISLQYDYDIAFKIFDKIKNLGYKYSTIYPISLTIDGFNIGYSLEYKKENVFNGANKFENYQNEDKLLESTKDIFRYKDLINSGARGNWTQAKQMFLSRGYLADIHGKIIDDPIVSSFYDGLTQAEYFSGCYGTRKGLIDTAENTAKSGYLTRTLVYAASGCEFDETCEDCGTPKYITIKIKDKNMLKSVAGRWYINNDQLEQIKLTDNHLINQDIKLRSPITCTNPKGICKKCYGDGYKINRSPYIGVIAAQSAGEITTQLVLRTFHLSGSAFLEEGSENQSDIISDLKILDKIYYGNKEYYSTHFNREKVEDTMLTIYNIYSKHSNINLVHIEVLFSQMLWYMLDDTKTRFSKLRYITDINPDQILNISIKIVPIYENWLLACLYSDVNKNLLRGLLERKPFDNVLTKVVFNQVN